MTGWERGWRDRFPQLFIGGVLVYRVSNFSIPPWGKTAFSVFPQNLVKPLRRGFLEYVVDSVGGINVANVAVLPFAG